MTQVLQVPRRRRQPTGSSSSTPSPSSTTHPSCTRSSHRRRSRASSPGYGFEALHYDIDGPHGDGVVVGRHGSAEGPEHGQADRARAAQRPVRRRGTGPTSTTRPAPAGRQPGAPQAVGHRLVRVLPELHDPGLGAGLVPHVPLLADGLQPAHLRGHALLRAAEERARAHRARSSRR